MWKKVSTWIFSDVQKGYEKLCCIQCAQNEEHNFKSVCICRVGVRIVFDLKVPKANLPDGKIVECCHCGCRGCASGDGSRKVDVGVTCYLQSKKREVKDEGDETRKRIDMLRSLMENGENEENENENESHEENDEVAVNHENEPDAENEDNEVKDESEKED